MVKVSTVRMALRVIDRAIQLHGAAGLSQDFFLAAYAMLPLFVSSKIPSLSLFFPVEREIFRYSVL